MLIEHGIIRFVWSVYLWSILSIDFIYTADKTESNQICHSLATDDDEVDRVGKELNILAVGLTRKHLLLITRDFYVYELPKDSLDSSINRLYLNATPTPLSVKYPVLFNSSEFNSIKKELFNAFILIDNKTDWLCITTWDKETDEAGIKYDLINDKVQSGFYFLGDQKELLISTDKHSMFYSLRYSQKTNGLEIATYTYSDSDVSINLTNPYRVICYGDEQKQTLIIKKYGEMCENHPVKWPIMNGFVAGDRFYLFEKNNTQIFSEDAYMKPNKAVSIEKSKYSSFFICPGSSLAENFLTKNRSILIIILIILFASLFILICLLLIRVENHKTFDQDFGKTIRSSLDLKQRKRRAGIPGTSKFTETATIRSSLMTDSRSTSKNIPFSRIKLMPTTRSLELNSPFFPKQAVLKYKFKISKNHK
uniref:Uncharacterized protein LOC113799593 n=1 Tax=Dermatophagoides pteronyssinus TaxID=6956 RepID=A0A6P6YLI6_DERPT